MRFTAPITLALCWILLSGPAQAGTPTLVNYQGRLTSIAGTPVTDGSYSVVFSIYTAATGGPAIWTETQSVTTSNGLFAVLLGSVSPITDAVFAGTTSFLGTRVGADPEITPRTRLVTVPYAFRISTVDGSTGGSISGNITLENSTSTAGNIYKGADLFLHNYGNANVFLGRSSGNLTTTGGENTSIGDYTLQSNSSGNYNSALGTAALMANESGYANTAAGHSALYTNIGGYGNTALGASTLTFNVDGDENTAVGSNALNFNSSGSSNTASGTAAMYNATTGSWNTASGAFALFYTVGDFNCGIGGHALDANTSGTANTAIGYNADVAITNLTNATAIGANAVVNASNKIRLGDANVSVIEGQVAYTYTSDVNQKENFQAVNGDEVLRKMKDLKVTSWNYKNQDQSQFRHYGPVAQDFFNAFGRDGVGTIGTPTTINSGDMAGIMIIAIQALEKRTAEVQSLRSDNAQLRTELDELKAAVLKLARDAKKGADYEGK